MLLCEHSGRICGICTSWRRQKARVPPHSPSAKVSLVVRPSPSAAEQLVNAFFSAGRPAYRDVALAFVLNGEGVHEEAPERVSPGSDLGVLRPEAPASSDRDIDDICPLAAPPPFFSYTRPRQPSRALLRRKTRHHVNATLELLITPRLGIHLGMYRRIIYQWRRFRSGNGGRVLDAYSSRQRATGV